MFVRLKTVFVFPQYYTLLVKCMSFAFGSLKKEERKMQLKICFFEESHNNYRKKGVLKKFAKLTEKQSCGPED